MKKLLAILLCFVVVLSLCACGGKEDPQTPDNTEKTTLDSGTDIEESTSPSVQESTKDPVEIVRSFIDKPVAELYAQIGEPESADYAPSCMGDGEDGMLFYDGFIVYTYREGDVETVCDVE